MSDVIYLNPAGNITALFTSFNGSKDDMKKAMDILNSNMAEQVGYETSPIMGGDCRINMLGDEFCANAARAYGYYHAVTNRLDGDIINVEVSGSTKPVKVHVDTESGESYTDMLSLVHSDIDRIRVLGYDLPVIRMDGIDHVIFETRLDSIIRSEMDLPNSKRSASYRLIDEIIKNDTFTDSKAVGIMFVNGDKIVPYVRVTGIGSEFWESSCGSGTTAYFYYLLDRIIKTGNYDAISGDGLLRGIYRGGSEYEFASEYKEPCGTISMRAVVKDHRITELLMGGEIRINE